MSWRYKDKGSRYYSYGKGKRGHESEDRLSKTINCKDTNRTTVKQ